jgi:hypothetical protein
MHDDFIQVRIHPTSLSGHTKTLKITAKLNVKSNRGKGICSLFYVPFKIVNLASLAQNIFPYVQHKSIKEHCRKSSMVEVGCFIRIQK